MSNISDKRTRFAAFSKATDKEIKRGDIIEDFRGDARIFKSLVEGNTKIYSAKVGSDEGRIHFPSVFPDIQIREVEE